jgi:hypothetical protein
LSRRCLGEARGLLLGLALGLVIAGGTGSAAGTGGAGPTADCEALRAALEQVLRQALAAETALLSRTRREICPDLEAPAEAPAVVPPVAGTSKAAGAGTAEAPAIDFGALRACRQEAERQVQSRWPLLYTDQARFRYFTPAGAALAREADALRQRRAAAGCLLGSRPGRRVEETVQRTGRHQHLFVAGIERAGQQFGAAEHGTGR